MKEKLTVATGSCMVVSRARRGVGAVLGVIVDGGDGAGSGNSSHAVSQLHVLGGRRDVAGGVVGAPVKS